MVSYVYLFFHFRLLAINWLLTDVRFNLLARVHCILLEADAIEFATEVSTQTSRRSIVLSYRLYSCWRAEFQFTFLSMDMNLSVGEVNEPRSSRSPLNTYTTKHTHKSWKLLHSSHANDLEADFSRSLYRVLYNIHMYVQKKNNLFQRCQQAHGIHMYYSTGSKTKKKTTKSQRKNVRLDVRCCWPSQEWRQ